MGRREEGRERGSWERERVRTGDVRRRVKKAKEEKKGAWLSEQLSIGETGEEAAAQEAEEEEGLFFAVSLFVSVSRQMSALLCHSLYKSGSLYLSLYYAVCPEKGGRRKKGNVRQ